MGTFLQHEQLNSEMILRVYFCSRAWMNLKCRYSILQCWFYLLTSFLLNKLCQVNDIWWIVVFTSRFHNDLVIIPSAHKYSLNYTLQWLIYGRTWKTVPSPNLCEGNNSLNNIVDTILNIACMIRAKFGTNSDYQYG